MSESGTLQRNKVKFFNNEEYDFARHTLLLPAVSVGNVGQLAVDLLLENLNPRPLKIGQIFHDALEPVVGNSGDGNLMTACELFHHVKQKLVILQFHSPVTRKNLGNFVDFLTNWILDSKFDDVLCLGSSLASLRNDVQLNQPTPRFLASSSVNLSKLNQTKALGWKELESAATQFTTNDTSPLSLHGEIRIPGGGIARDLFMACNSANISILTLILFASDGDNTPESLTLLRSINELYQFIPTPSNSAELKLRIPAAWEYFNGGVEPSGIF